MKLLIFTEAKWAFGSLYTEACKHLVRHGIVTNMLDWGNAYTLDDMQSLLTTYDYIVSTYNGVPILMNDYQIPANRIIIQIHGEPEFLNFQDTQGLDIFNQVAEYAVVGNSLVNSSVTMGISRVPKVTYLGITTDLYRIAISEKLTTVGYAATYKVLNKWGTDIKRGVLAEQATANAGLIWNPSRHVPFGMMPAYYSRVDAVVMSSLQEGFGLGVMEAAAAGRLVIGTEVGNWTETPELGITAPVREEDFVPFVSDTLKWYANNPVAYREKCLAAQNHVRAWDWQHKILSWVKLFRSLPRKISC